LGRIIVLRSLILPTLINKEPLLLSARQLFKAC
jgi:hypothetical protein